MEILSPDFWLASFNTFLDREHIPGLVNRACGDPSQPHNNQNLRWCGGRRIDYNGIVYYVLPLVEAETTPTGKAYCKFHGVEIYKKTPTKYSMCYFQKIATDPKYKGALDEKNNDWQIVRQATTDLIIDVYRALKIIIKEDFKHESQI